jgi:hypothetical protein
MPGKSAAGFSGQIIYDQSRWRLTTAAKFEKQYTWNMIHELT